MPTASLLNRIARDQCERRDLDVKLLSVRAGHLIGTVHLARRRFNWTPRRVLKRFPRRKHRLLAHYACAFDLFGPLKCIRDDPMPADQLNRLVPLIRDPNRVLEYPFCLRWMRLLWRVARQNLNPDMIRHGIGDWAGFRLQRSHTDAPMVTSRGCRSRFSQSSIERSISSNTHLVCVETWTIPESRFCRILRIIASPSHHATVCSPARF